MKKALIVARWEFLTTVMRRSYIFTVAAVPLFFGAMMLIPILTGRTAVMSNASAAPVAIVDGAGLIDVEFARDLAARREAARDGTTNEAPPPRLARYTDLDAAVADLAAGEVSAVYAIDADYTTTGIIRAYGGGGGGPFAQLSSGQRQGQVVDAIRAGLLRGALDGDALTRAYAPAARLERYRVSAAGEVTPADSGAMAGMAALGGSFVVIMLLTMSIFISAGMLQQATLEDRQNRVIEILMSSVTSDQLLLGKMLGLGAAGLLQVAIYVALIIIPGAAMFAFIQVPLGSLLLSLLYFPLGFLLFASLMVGVGMLGRTPQESGQLSAIWSIVAVSPLWFTTVLVQSPNGLAARLLSYFPLTMPVTMVIRITSGAVPPLDYVITIIIGVVSIYFALRGAARIFRASTLMYGKRPTLPELLRWLRAA